MDYTNIPLGLRVQTQIPLNVKTYKASEADLKNLGTNNNLAFTYEKGLIVYCVLEGTRYEWKEMQPGETGLLDDNFIYPNNISTFGINYSNKEYNFVKTEFDQNNIVKSVYVDEAQLPPFPYTIQDVIDYFLTLSEADRTLNDTTSKFNIVVGSATEGGGFLVYRIYELQNIGKGIITTLDESNLLLIKSDPQGLQETLNFGSTLTLDNNIIILEKLRINAGTGGNTNGISIFDPIYGNTTTPIVKLGKGIGNTTTDVSLNFYPDKATFNDSLNSKGLEYSGDYENNFSSRSLVTKQYVDNLVSSNQKLIVYPTDFISNNYTLSSSDNNKLIIVDNGITNVIITIPTGLPNEFFVAIIREGVGEISCIASGTVINNSVSGLRINRRYDQIALDKKGNTNIFYLTGNVKV